MATCLAPPITNVLEVRDVLDKQDRLAQHELSKKESSSATTTTPTNKKKKKKKTKKKTHTNETTTKDGDRAALKRQESKKQPKVNNKNTERRFFALVQLPSDISSVAFTDDLESSPSFERSTLSAGGSGIRRTPPPLPRRPTRLQMPTRFDEAPPVKQGQGSKSKTNNKENEATKFLAQVGEGKRKMKRALTAVSKKTTHAAKKSGTKFQLKIHKTGEGSTYRARGLSKSLDMPPTAPPRTRRSKRHQRNESGNPMFDMAFAKSSSIEKKASEPAPKVTLRRKERVWKLRDTFERLSAKRRSALQAKAKKTSARSLVKAKKPKRNAALDDLMRRRAETITIDDIVSGVKTIPAGTIKRDGKYQRAPSGRSRAETITLEAIMSGEVETIPEGTMGGRNKSGKSGYSGFSQSTSGTNTPERQRVVYTRRQARKLAVHPK
jgi:hypothetical protein